MLIRVWILGHVSINGNPKADAKAREAKKMTITNIILSYTDYTNKITECVKKLANHLGYVFKQPTVGTSVDSQIGKCRIIT